VTNSKYVFFWSCAWSTNLKIDIYPTLECLYLLNCVRVALFQVVLSHTAIIAKFSASSNTALFLCFSKVMSHLCGVYTQHRIVRVDRPEVCNLVGCMTITSLHFVKSATYFACKTIEFNACGCRYGALSVRRNFFVLYVLFFLNLIILYCVSFRQIWGSKIDKLVRLWTWETIVALRHNRSNGRLAWSFKKWWWKFRVKMYGMCSWSH